MKRFITILLLFSILLTLGQSFALATTSTADTNQSEWPIERIGGSDRIETANLICRAGWEDYIPLPNDPDSTDDPEKDDNDEPSGTIVSSADVSSSDVSPSDVSSSDIISDSDLDTDYDDSDISDSDIDNTVDDTHICAIITNGYQFADALAGVPLAAAVNAPILLTNGTELRDSVMSEINRIGADRIYILGGEIAVGKAIENKLESTGFEVIRLSGATRYDTAVEIARELESINGQTPDSVFVAYAFNYPDALSAGTVAGLLGSPILYSNTAGTPDESTAAYIKDTNDADIVLLGGEMAISAAAENNFGKLTQGSTKRINGSTRYDTATAICSNYLYLFSGKNIILASGNDFPDALAGGSFAASIKVPLLLINNQLHTDGLYSFVKTIAPEKIYLLGGQVAVSDGIVNTILSGGTVTRPTTTAPAPVIPENHIDRKITIKSNSAKVYSDKSTSSAVVATVKKNAVFDVIDEGADSKQVYTWFKINVNGKTGWICRTEVTIENTFYTIPKKTFNSDNKAVIYLSPSCQGDNAYATGKTTEQAEMEAVGAIVKQILDREYDCITYMANPKTEINDRTAEALACGADIYVAIHSNATGTSATAYGASSYYFPACAQSKLLSQNVVAELNKIAPKKPTLAYQVINGMNVFYGIGYSEIRHPSDVGMVAILAETEFHDNKIGSDWIRSHHNEIARAYVNAIVKTFNIPKK